jgi:trimethylamine:corrinoid methyltransferase-like protein
MVLDDEMAAGLRRLMEGGETHDLAEEVALIKANTPRGNFLKEKHTRRTFRRHWQPTILSRDSYEAWSAKGETIEEMCRRRVREVLEKHRPPALSAEVEAELERIVRRYVGPVFGLETGTRWCSR